MPHKALPPRRRICEYIIGAAPADGPFTTRFDPAVYLDTDDARLEYLVGAMRTRDTAFILDACVVIARSMGKHDAGG